MAFKSSIQPQYFAAAVASVSSDVDSDSGSASQNGDNVKVATPEEFVKRYGGNRVIKKVLIANNGIAGKSRQLCCP